MKALLSLLLMLLGSSLPATGIYHSPDLDQRCPANTTILGDEEWANITIMEDRASASWGLNLFVHPDSGFKGVRLVSKGDDWQHDVWFTLDNTCFPRDAEWQALYVGVWKKRNDDNNDYDLWPKVRAGDCAFKCRKTGRYPGDVKLTVAGHGPSRWRLESPAPCTVERYTNKTYSLINCKSNPINTTSESTIALTPITIIVASVMICVAVLVVVLVVVTRRFRKRRELSQVPRVPPRLGLAASWGAGGEAADDDNYVDPPRVPTVLPCVRLERGVWHVVDEASNDDKRTESPRVGELPRQEPDYLFFGDEEGEEHIYEDINAPRLAAVLPRGAPLQEETNYLHFGGEEPIYNNIDLPAPPPVYENVDTDEDTYLTPRRAPTGTHTLWGHRGRRP
ncbi:uncharacterized protein LOC127006067 [Eriocheir sinensis]|uniref:uncharacterized protein LOC127006067 n=1 Tax=Eriocheir sinensis TaxID=95602 RepID=UPI0021C66B19|nr:uncharacterized protein LOC127006067 [Eriocheir sinensis]